jgi:hypothetical protein
MLTSTTSRVAIGAAVATAALATFAAFLAPSMRETESQPLLPAPPRRLPPPRAIARMQTIEPAPIIAPPRARKSRSKRASMATPIASEYAPFADYQIKRYRTDRVGPTCIVEWSDGQITRLSVASLPGKPLNVGRALRVSLTAWESRARKKQCRPRHIPRDVCDAARAALLVTLPRPNVIACRFEREGETIGRFDPAECNQSLQQTGG